MTNAEFDSTKHGAIARRLFQTMAGSLSSDSALICTASCSPSHREPRSDRRSGMHLTSQRCPGKIKNKRSISESTRSQSKVTSDRCPEMRLSNLQFIVTFTLHPSTHKIPSSLPTFLLSATSKSPISFKASILGSSRSRPTTSSTTCRRRRTLQVVIPPSSSLALPTRNARSWPLLSSALLARTR